MHRYPLGAELLELLCVKVVTVSKKSIFKGEILEEIKKGTTRVLGLEKFISNSIAMRVR